jgi:3-oxoacyl-[acyl-carrier-protein] synthase II
MLISDMSAGRVSMQYGLKGPNYAVVSACASGAHAIGDAFIGIKAGMMDIALAGGSEAVICPTAMAGFSNMKALSTRNDEPTRASRPFDKGRDGFVIGEGAGVIVLESLEHALKRGARIYGELIGYGATGDAYHLSAPAPEGEGACRAMQMAIRMAGIPPSAIDYINAHGTSTPFNDKFESIAMRTALGERALSVNISSTKSMTGHMLGATGAVEFIISTLAIRDSIVPPTINYEDPDPECGPLNFTPNTAVRTKVDVALSNSFGFGGHNASLIVRKYEASESNA